MLSVWENRVIKGILGLSALFFVLITAVPTPLLVMVLNGIFTGVLIAVAYAYGPLIYQAIFNRYEYSGARQMALGILCLWLAFILSRSYSVIYRIMDRPERLQDIPLIPVAIYLAIIGGILQVTAAEFDLGPFSSRDKKTLWIASILGFVVAIVIILLQVY